MNMEKAYETCLDMLMQRGYEIVDEEENRITGEKQDGTQICVFLVNTSKFNVSSIEEYINLMNSLDVKHGIIVYKDSITSFAKKIVDSSEEIDIELFAEEDLKYNITEHRLVPLHERMSREEAEEFKKRYGTKLPGILRTDPVARFYGFKRGDIVRITRSSGHITYRLVR